MYQTYDAHFLTVLIVVGTLMVTPFYVFATYAFSNASKIKGVWIACAFLVFGAFMFWVCLGAVPGRLGFLGNLIVPLAWLLPTLMLYWKKDWFLKEKLSQRWLVGLQIFRVIGGVFLVEMGRGNLPGIFAYPAGIGDILVGLVALMVVLTHRMGQAISKGLILLLIILGVADFISAFFFGFFSSQHPLQLFYSEVQNQVIVFPTGLIPLFLVPYAIFFHFLSWLNYKKFGE